MVELTESSDFAPFVQAHLATLLEYGNMFFPKFTINAVGEKEEVSLRGFQENSVQLVPSADSPLFAYLQADYQEMLDSGMIYGNSPPTFNDVLGKCQKIAKAYNALPH
jgi:hypothetical protein